MEEIVKNNQFVLLDQALETDNEIGLIDIGVYLWIRYHLNSKTGQCNPSINRLSKLCQLSRGVLIKSIKLLESKGFIKVNKLGRSNNYSFPKLIKFSKIAFLFLKNNFLTLRQKSYIAILFNKMYINRNYGTITLTNSEICDITHQSLRSVKYMNAELERKGVLVLADMKYRESDGVVAQSKIFDLSKLGLLLLDTVIDHEIRLNELEDNINNINQEVRDDIDQNKIEIASLRKMVDSLYKELQKERTKKYEERYG